MSNTDKKQYKCVLPTNGYEAGDVVELTDAEVANFNGGEKLPRFVPVDEGSESTTMSDELKDTENSPEGQPEGQPEAQPQEGEGEGSGEPKQPEGEPEGQPEGEPEGGEGTGEAGE